MRCSFRTWAAWKRFNSGCNNIIDRHLKKDKKERKPREKTEQELFEKEKKNNHSRSIYDKPKKKTKKNSYEIIIYLFHYFFHFLDY